jgi:hypothetical protein
MSVRYWKSTADDPNRCCRRQAEFLVHRRFPFSLVTEIATYNDTRAKQCRDILAKGRLTIPVIARPSWYY